MDNAPPPSYIQATNSIVDYESESNLNDKITIKTNKTAYTIPRRNLLKVKNSYFGKYFLNKFPSEKGNESNYINEISYEFKNEFSEDFIMAWLSQPYKENNHSFFEFTLESDDINIKMKIMDEMKNLDMYDNFILTSLGANWKELIDLDKYYDDVLSNEELGKSLADIWIRAINEALHQNIYIPEFEITKNGRIALNRKDITQLIIHKYGKNINRIDDMNLLINFCLYADIQPFFQRIYSNILSILFPYLNRNELINEATAMNGGKPLMCVTPICLPDEQAKCCFQSSFHRHVRINLLPYINACYRK